MVNEVENNKAIEKPEVKKKKAGWGKVLKFIMYGGWLLVLLLVMGIIILIDKLT